MAVRGLRLKVTVEKLGEEPYAFILCYPRPCRVEIRKRLAELRKLCVIAVEFCGEKEAFGIPVLGKGCVGIVTIAYVNGDRVALKIRRVDADRDGMLREAEMLRKANSVCVGPKLLDVSENFLLMQFVDGALFPEWLKKRRGKAHVRAVLREVLEQCWRLDAAGLDHGELSHAPKHIIVEEKDKPFIVDFETASLNRRSSNVTSICQFLFLSGEVADRVVRKVGVEDKGAVVDVLRCYKRDRTRGNFERVLDVCGLLDDVVLC